jgi:type IV pilus assembly protein PilQ
MKETVPPAKEQTPEPAKGRVTFNLKDADIHDVFHTFSLRYGIVVVAAPDVKGRVTMNLTDVPWESALKRIVESCGYSLVKEGEVYRVLPGADLRVKKAAPQAAGTPAQPTPVQATPTAGAPSPSGPAATPAVAKGAEKAPEESAEGEPPDKLPSAPGRVTFDFKDADITNILRIFSTRYGINIVAGPEVKGKVTIRLVDVPWEAALKLILESNDYSYIKKGNVVRVISREQLDKEPLETQVFPLSYARATEVVNSITHLLTPARGQIKPDDRSNTLVVTDTPAKLVQIEEIINRLDRRTPQVLIESRILELKDDFDENIGINWVSLKGWDITFGPPENEGIFSITREEVYGREDSHADVFSDIITRVETEDSLKGKSDTTTTTISTSGGTSGTDITHTDTLVSTTGRGAERIRESGRSGINNLSNPDGGSLGSQDMAIDQRGKRVMTTDLRQAVLTPDDFQLTISFLQEQTDANLISHPKLVTADNKESTIKVSEQWPLPKFSLNSQTGQYDITDFQYKDIGIILKVKPHVNEDDFINMLVTPEVSNISGTTSFGGAIGATLPIIQTRTAVTDVLIKNGQTLAIGGLMTESESDVVNKLPLLGDIPLMGPYVFTNSSKKIVNRNLLIFITANVVTEENKDNLWVGQREDQARRLNLPRTKWWEPKKLRHGLGSKAGY